MVCKKTGLNPFAKQIHAVMRKTKDGHNTMTIQTSVDGFRLIADRTGCYAPGREATYEYNDKGDLVSATAYVKKMTKDGTWHEVSANAAWDEYAVYYNEKPSTFWAKMPRVMLSKCAESLALRKAFPAEMSGIYTREEMQQADNDARPEVVTDSAKQMESIETISISQIDTLHKMLQPYPSLVDGLLDWVNVESFDKIPAKSFDKVVKATQRQIDKLTEVAI